MPDDPPEADAVVFSAEGTEVRVTATSVETGVVAAVFTAWSGVVVASVTVMYPLRVAVLLPRYLLPSA